MIRNFQQLKYIIIIFNIFIFNPNGSTAYS
jgi:hypothetical protein